MKNFFIQNKLLVITGSLAIVVIITFISFFTFSDQRSNPINSPSPTIDPNTLPVGSGEPAQGRDYQLVTPENEQRFIEDAALSNFIKTLPYKGEFVRIDYSYDDNSFTIRMDPDNVSKAEQELNDLLVANRISDVSKLSNLKVIK